MAKRPAGDVQRRPLTRALIVATTIALIERDGAKALSMRKIAAELGVGVMSLYNHVPNKDALLEAVAEEVLAGLDAAGTDPALDWRHNARAMVAAFRAAARRYPRSMHLVLSGRAGRVFGRRPMERALMLFGAAGFDPETSVRALRALIAYMMGAQMMEGGALRIPGRRPGDLTGPHIDVDLAEIPHVAAVADDLLRSDPEADFQTGLDMLLSALDRLPRRAG